MPTLLLQPPRSLCASTGHYPHLPSWEPVNPTTARIPSSRTTSLENTWHAAGCCNVTLASAPAGSPHIPYPSLPSASVSQRPLISHSFDPLLSGRRTDARGQPTWKGRAKSKGECQELCEQRKEREISPCSLRSSGLNLHNQLDVFCI